MRKLSATLCARIQVPAVQGQQPRPVCPSACLEHRGEVWKSLQGIRQVGFGCCGRQRGGSQVKKLQCLAAVPPQLTLPLLCRSMHIIVERSQRLVCEDVEARKDFIVVPYHSPPDMGPHPSVIQVQHHCHILLPRTLWLLFEGACVVLGSHLCTLHVQARSLLAQSVSRAAEQYRFTLGYFLGECNSWGSSYGKRMRGWFVRQVQKLGATNLSVACTLHRKVRPHILSICSNRFIAPASWLPTATIPAKQDSVCCPSQAMTALILTCMLLW